MTPIAKQHALLISEENAKLRAEIERLRAALEAIESTCADEINARFGGHPSRSADEVGAKSAVYSLLVVPRNMARNALEQETPR